MRLSGRLPFWGSETRIPPARDLARVEVPLRAFGRLRRIVGAPRGDNSPKLKYHSEPAGDCDSPRGHVRTVDDTGESVEVPLRAFGRLRPSFTDIRQCVIELL